MSITDESDLHEAWPKDLEALRKELFGEAQAGETWNPVVKKFPIDLKELSLDRKLASGSTGPLYHGVYKGREVVVKVRWLLKTDQVEKYDQMKRYILREIEMTSGVRHENVVEFIGACFKDSVYCIVMEYIPGGNLSNLLNRNKHSLPLKTVLFMALDIARGMAHLHSKGIVHRDLKPDNLLVDAKGRIKITDFGSARSVRDWSDFTGETGTYRWMAPEMMKNEMYNRKVDVYSFGFVFWQMFSYKLPFEELTPMQTVMAVTNKNQRPTFPRECPEELALLIQKTWKTDPDARPEFFQIIRKLEIIAGIRFSLSREAWKIFKHSVSYQW